MSDKKPIDIRKETNLPEHYSERSNIWSRCINSIAKYFQRNSLLATEKQPTSKIEYSETEATDKLMFIRFQVKIRQSSISDIPEDSDEFEQLIKDIHEADFTQKNYSNELINQLETKKMNDYTKKINKNELLDLDKLKKQIEKDNTLPTEKKTKLYGQIQSKKEALEYQTMRTLIVNAIKQSPNSQMEISLSEENKQKIGDIKKVVDLCLNLEDSDEFDKVYKNLNDTKTKQIFKRIYTISKYNMLQKTKKINDEISKAKLKTLSDVRTKLNNDPTLPTREKEYLIRQINYRKIEIFFKAINETEIKNLDKIEKTILNSDLPEQDKDNLLNKIVQQPIYNAYLEIINNKTTYKINELGMPMGNISNLKKDIKQSNLPNTDKQKLIKLINEKQDSIKVNNEYTSLKEIDYLSGLNEFMSKNLENKDQQPIEINNIYKNNNTPNSLDPKFNQTNVIKMLVKNIFSNNQNLTIHNIKFEKNEIHLEINRHSNYLLGKAVNWIRGNKTVIIKKDTDEQVSSRIAPKTIYRKLLPTFQLIQLIQRITNSKELFNKLQEDFNTRYEKSIDKKTTEELFANYLTQLIQRATNSKELFNKLQEDFNTRYKRSTEKKTTEELFAKYLTEKEFLKNNDSIQTLRLLTETLDESPFKTFILSFIENKYKIDTTTEVKSKKITMQKAIEKETDILITSLTNPLGNLIQTLEGKEMSPIPKPHNGNYQNKNYGFEESKESQSSSINQILSNGEIEYDTTTDTIKSITLKVDGETKKTRITSLEKGSFGNVYTVKINDKTYALKDIKHIEGSAASSPQQVLKEYNIGKKTYEESTDKSLFLEQNAIFHVDFSGKILTPPIDEKKLSTVTHTYILMEYFPGESIYSQVTKKHKPFSITDKLNVALSILKALKNLNKINVVWNDAKPENILLHNKEIKIIDFGLSYLAQKTDLEESTTPSGTPPYFTKLKAFNILLSQKHTPLCRFIDNIIDFKDKKEKLMALFRLHDICELNGIMLESKSLKKMKKVEKEALQSMLKNQLNESIKNSPMNDDELKEHIYQSERATVAAQIFFMLFNRDEPKAASFKRLNEDYIKRCINVQECFENIKNIIEKEPPFKNKDNNGKLIDLFERLMLAPSENYNIDTDIETLEEIIESEPETSIDRDSQSRNWFPSVFGA